MVVQTPMIAAKHQAQDNEKGTKKTGQEPKKLKNQKKRMEYPH